MSKDAKMAEFVSAITDQLNKFNFDQDAFNQAMSNEHRTLQQNFTRLCFAWLEHLASEEYKTDDRNGASQVMAKKLISLYQKDLVEQGIDPEYLQYYKLPRQLPMI
jgi:hypothetical protein